MINLTDEQLIVEIKNGNIDRFEILVRRYQQKLYYFICRYISDRTLIDEIIQDTFFNLYKSIDRIDTTKKISPYLFQIAKNNTITYLRKNRSEIRLEGIEIANYKDDTYEDLIKKETALFVRKAINKLSSNFQKIIRLYYFDNMSYKSIQKKLGLPLGTIKTRLRRAKLQLAVLLKDENR